MVSKKSKKEIYLKEIFPQQDIYNKEVERIIDVLQHGIPYFEKQIKFYREKIINYLHLIDEYDKELSELLPKRKSTP